MTAPLGNVMPRKGPEKRLLLLGYGMMGVSLARSFSAPAPLFKVDNAASAQVNE